MIDEHMGLHGRRLLGCMAGGVLGRGSMDPQTRMLRGSCLRLWQTNIIG